MDKLVVEQLRASLERFSASGSVRSVLLHLRTVFAEGIPQIERALECADVEGLAGGIHRCNGAVLELEHFAAFAKSLREAEQAARTGSPDAFTMGLQSLNELRQIDAAACMLLGGIE